MADFYISVTAEVKASDLLNVEVNFDYCKRYASFQHQTQKEFILSLGVDSYYTEQVKTMQNFGCTPEFIKLYQLAREMGVNRLCLYTEQ